MAIITHYNNDIYKSMHWHHTISNSDTILFSLMNMNCFQVVDLDLADFCYQKCQFCTRNKCHTLSSLAWPDLQTDGRTLSALSGHGSSKRPYD